MECVALSHGASAAASLHPPPPPRKGRVARLLLLQGCGILRAHRYWRVIQGRPRSHRGLAPRIPGGLLLGRSEPASESRSAPVRDQQGEERARISGQEARRLPEERGGALPERHVQPPGLRQHLAIECACSNSRVNACLCGRASRAEQLEHPARMATDLAAHVRGEMLDQRCIGMRQLQGLDERCTASRFSGPIL